MIAPHAKKLTLLALAIAGMGAFYLLGLDQYLTIAGLQARRLELLALYDRYPLLFIACFMLIQICALALCLPGAVLSLALAGGALFGPIWGTLIVLSAITIGDTLGFLLARHLLRDFAERRFGPRLAAIDKGVDEDGALYLAALRLMAVVPYFVVNVAMALTRMRLQVFAPVSFIGLAPATALYVNAGTELANIRTASDILSLRLLVILALLGLIPLLARLAYKAWRKRRAPV